MKFNQLNSTQRTYALQVQSSLKVKSAVKHMFQYFIFWSTAAFFTVPVFWHHFIEKLPIDFIVFLKIASCFYFLLSNLIIILMMLGIKKAYNDLLSGELLDLSRNSNIIKTFCFSKASPLFVTSSFKENAYIFFYIVAGAMYASIGWWVWTILIVTLLFFRHTFRSELINITKNVIEKRLITG